MASNAPINLPKQVNIRIVIDQSGVLAMVGAAEKSFPNAYKFAERYIIKAIKAEIFTTFIQNLAGRAGPGFPQIYTDHLIAAMQHIPISVRGNEEVYGGAGNYLSTYNGVSVEFDLETLGDFQDFEKGAHYHALLAQGGEDNHPASSGARNHGSASDRHHGLNPHPARVELPYAGQDLMNQKEARESFWERVVVEQDYGYELLLQRGKENWTLQDHMDRMGYTVSTLEETYFARTLAWGTKAPQWLLLQFGSGRLFGKAAPIIQPVDIANALQLVTNCVGNKIFKGVIESLVVQATEQGSQLNKAGQPFEIIPGRGASYAPYKEITSFHIPSYSECLGSI